MKKAYLIKEENHGVIGVAKDVLSAMRCLVTEKWLTSEEAMEALKPDRVNLASNLEKYGIFLEETVLW